MTERWINYLCTITSLEGTQGRLCSWLVKELSFQVILDVYNSKRKYGQQLTAYATPIVVHMCPEGDYSAWLSPGGSDKITCSNYCWCCIHFTMAFCIEKRNTWPQQTVVYFDLFRSCLQSTSYILVETVLRPAAPRRYHGYWDWRWERDRRDQQPALSSCSKWFSGDNNVKTTDRIPSTTCLE